MTEVKENTEAKWYAVQTYHGKENTACKNLIQKVDSESMQKKILDAVVPEVDKIVIRRGKRVTKKEKIYPSYLLVNMVSDKDTVSFVKGVNGISGFVGSKKDPIPLSEKEVDSIFSKIKEDATKHNIDFMVGEVVRIVEGPFGEINGKISEIDKERGQMVVLVNMFGRDTPMKLDVVQIRKL